MGIASSAPRTTPAGWGEASRRPAPHRRNDIFVLAAALMAIALVGVLDRATGTELRIYPLYVVPIAAVSWRLGPRFGVLVSACAVATWFGSNLMAGLRLPLGVWVLNATAHLTAFATVVVLVTHLQRSREAETRLARTDPLTGLQNTRAFYETAAAEIDRQRRYPHPVTLAFVDLDNFKAINDRFGHKTGDAALRAVAQALRATTRATDVLSRMGGDEFVLLLPETGLEGAREILQRVRSAVSMAMGKGGWPVSCSIGAVTFSDPPQSVDALIGVADGLMYRVKQSGKNAVCVEELPDARVPRSSGGVVREEGTEGERS